MSAVPVLAGAPGSVFTTGALPLCAHCGLPVAGLGHAPGPLYCCGGCALAHRLTGGPAGHGQAVGLLMSIGIGAFLAMNVMALSFILYSGRGEADRLAGEAWVRWALLALATPALALLGLPFLSRGARRLRERVLDVDALVVVGVSAAFALSVRSVLSGHGPLYLDTAMGILLFVTIGRYLEAASRARTTDALKALVSRIPERAARVVEGREEVVPVDALVPGDLVRVRPGERIPVDGVVADGGSSVSESEITGESVPSFKGAGARVSACTVCLDGTLLVRADRTGPDTTVARLVRLVDEARAGRYTLAPLVDRVTALFVPAVLVLASATFLFWTHRAGPGAGLMNALCVLLIACPCAIGIAMPLASTAAVGRAASAGVLVRSGAIFEALARSRRVFLDKTGTLTTGSLERSGVRPAPGVPPAELLALAAAAERGSEHPVARALRDVVPAGVDATAFRAVPGQGVEARVAWAGVARLVRVGSRAWVPGAPDEPEPGASVVHLSTDGVWLGTLSFRDGLRPSAGPAVAALVRRGVAVEVLSGDQAAAVEPLVAALPGVVGTGGLLPEEKLARIRAAGRDGDLPVMVGDGINDALALSGAAVGVTLESGTDLAREVSDVTILGGDLTRLPWVLDLAKRTMRTARLNLFWAFFYNVVGLGLAVSGLLHPLFGAVAMIASSLLVVVHSQRLARTPLPEGGIS